MLFLMKMPSRQGYCHFVFYVILLLHAPLTLAEPIGQIQQLIEEGNPQAAYELALQQRQELEGDLQFDYYYGVAAIDSGHINEGVFALERVSYQQPSNMKAKLELARGYYLQGDDARARRGFESVLRSKPPQKVAENIEHFLSKIRLRETRTNTTATAYVELQLGSDSNINAGPDTAIADSALPWTLNANVLEKSDNIVNLLLGGRIHHPVTQHDALFANVDATLRKHASEDNYDNQLITLQAGKQWQREQQRRRLSALLQQYRVDGTVSRNLGGLIAENTWLLGYQRQLTASLTMLLLDHPEIPIKDSRQYTLNLQYLRANNGLTWAAGLNLGREVANENNNVAQSQADRTIYGVQLASQMKLNKDTSWGAQFTSTQSAYSADYLFGVLPKRKELLSNLELSITRLLDKQWQLRGSISYTRNDANIDMFSYTRTQAKAGVRYEF